MADSESVRDYFKNTDDRSIINVNYSDGDDTTVDILKYISESENHTTCSVYFYICTHKSTVNSNSKQKKYTVFVCSIYDIACMPDIAQSTVKQYTPLKAVTSRII